MRIGGEKGEHFPFYHPIAGCHLDRACLFHTQCEEGRMWPKSL